MAKRIAVLCEMLYQFDLELFLAGGGERWAIDFIELLKKNGYHVDIYQFSHESKTVKYGKHTINGIGNVKLPDYGKCMLAGLQYFKDRTMNYDGIFLLSMNLSHIKYDKPTLTVSHGIWWDCYEKLNHGLNMMDSMKSWIGNATKCISVDTNSIHAMQIFNPRNSKKMEYIPNYVDLNTFKYIPKSKSDKFRVLFPRRIDQARGYVEMAEAVKILNSKYDNFEFTFCGRGHEQEEKNLENLLQGVTNVKKISYDMSDMHNAYVDMDISCIPTVKSEGTSLSCLESLATGTVPIVTTIGGLTDLVQKGVNGLMINPSSSLELAEAIEYLYLNRDRLEEMRFNGLAMIKGFSKERWDADVLKTIKEVYGEA